MICKQCGNELAPDAKFCGVCGAVNDGAEAPQYAQPAQPQYEQPAQPQYEQPAQPQYAQPAQPQYAQPAQPQYTQPAQPQYAQPQYAQPQYGAAPVEDPQERALSKSCLIFGILGIAFGCSFYLSFLGIVFGAIAKSKAKLYAASYPLTGRAKTGRILGNVGFIVGIILTVFFVIWLIVIIAAASYSSSYYYYY